MESLPDSVKTDIQNYEVTVEPGHLTLIVSTAAGDLHTYTFSVDDDGSLSLKSQTENGAQVDNGVTDAIETLLVEHPLLTPDEISG